MLHTKRLFLISPESLNSLKRRKGKYSSTVESRALNIVAGKYPSHVCLQELINHSVA